MTERERNVAIYFEAPRHQRPVRAIHQMSICAAAAAAASALVRKKLFRKIE